jgi:hypothetical protein
MQWRIAPMGQVPALPERYYSCERRPMGIVRRWNAVASASVVVPGRSVSNKNAAAASERTYS